MLEALRAHTSLLVASFAFPLTTAYLETRGLLLRFQNGLVACGGGPDRVHHELLLLQVLLDLRVVDIAETVVVKVVRPGGLQSCSMA